MDLFEEIVRLKREGRACAVATIVECTGSSPQKEGAKMLIRDDGSTVGTLGGGCLEAEVIQAARVAVLDGAPLSLPFDLTERHGGLICGGKVTVFIEPVIPEPHLVILGAGHVGKALAKAARFSGFRVTVTDNRPEHANRESVPDASDTVVCEFEEVFSRVIVDGGTYIVIATRGHLFDLAALGASLRTPACYIGLLGSKRKRSVLFGALREKGFTDRDVGRVSIPVGLPIGSVTPEEIAVSIMAEIIQRRRAHGTRGHRSPACGGLIAEDAQAEAAPPGRE